MQTILHRNMKEHSTQRKGDIRAVTIFGEGPRKHKQEALDGVPRGRGGMDGQEGHLGDAAGEGIQKRGISSVSPACDAYDRPEKEWGLGHVGVWAGPGVQDGEELGVVGEESAVSVFHQIEIESTYSPKISSISSPVIRTPFKTCGVVGSSRTAGISIRGNEGPTQTGDMVCWG